MRQKTGCDRFLFGAVGKKTGEREKKKKKRYESVPFYERGGRGSQFHKLVGTFAK